MFQNHQFEKVSNQDSCARVEKSSISRGWHARSKIGNAFAFLVLALLMLGGVSPAAAENAKPLLDLNQATSAQLEGLPGIGEVKAAAILAVRDAQGGFKSVDDLESVRGIGPALVTKLRPMVRLGKSGSSARSSGAAAKPAAGTAGRSAK